MLFLCSQYQLIITSNLVPLMLSLHIENGKTSLRREPSKFWQILSFGTKSIRATAATRPTAAGHGHHIGRRVHRRASSSSLHCRKDWRSRQRSHQGRERRRLCRRQLVGTDRLNGRDQLVDRFLIRVRPTVNLKRVWWDKGVGKS